MDRWLIKQASPPAHSSNPPTALTSDRNELELDGESTDSLMEDAHPIKSAMRRLHQGPRSIKWTAINQPWRRNSHNAELFDSPVPEGSYLTLMRHTIRQGPTEYEEEASEEEAVDDKVELEKEEEEEEEGKEVVDGRQEQETASEPQIDYDILHATCEQIFKEDDPKLLTNERLLTVAGLYTNSEIVDKVRKYHPDTTLPYRIARITQRISESITRVAAQRGVAREVVKKEVDASRERFGVFGRQVAYNAVKCREAHERERMKRKTDVGAGAEGDVEVEKGEKDLDGGDAESKWTVSPAFPYGFGLSEKSQEPEIRDSEDDEEL